MRSRPVGRVAAGESTPGRPVAANPPVVHRYALAAARPQVAAEGPRSRDRPASLVGCIAGRGAATPLVSRLLRWLALGCLALLAGLLLAPGPATATAAPAVAGWVWPLDPAPAVVARFDAPTGPFAAGHRGVDLAATVGQPVLAAGRGTVAFAGTVAGKPVVSIDHAGGLRTTYEPVLAERPRGRPGGAGVTGRPGCRDPGTLRAGHLPALGASSRSRAGDLPGPAVAAGAAARPPAAGMGNGSARRRDGPTGDRSGAPAGDEVPSGHPRPRTADGRFPMTPASEQARQVGSPAAGSRLASCRPARTGGGSRGPPRS